MFWRLVVDSPSDQEIRQASLEGEYSKKDNWYYGLKRKGGLVIGIIWELFKVSLRILELVWQVTWSKVNKYAKWSGIIIKTMELHEKVEKNPKAENLYLFYHHLSNLEDEIYVKGG